MPSITDWDADPVSQFEAFVRSQEFAETSRRRRPDDAVLNPISNESAEIYSFMFQKFAAWLKDRGLAVSTVDGQSLYEFLELRDDGGRRDLNSRIAYRYLRLLERCYQHLAAAPNPAQAAILSAAQGARFLGRDKEMIALDPGQLTRFIAALPAVEGGWKRRRDRSMQLVMLLAGLRVAEVIGFLMTEVGRQPNLDGSLRLTITPEGKHQSSYQHDTILRQDGAQELLQWIAERVAMPIPGQLVFPANFRGDPLDKATVYRQVRATFDRANLDIARAGGRTLRNTFAMQELDEVSIAELTEHLGLALARSTMTYAIAKKKLK